MPLRHRSRFALLASLFVASAAVAGDPTSCGVGDIEDEWYCFTMPCGGTLTVSTCNPSTDYDTTLAIFIAGGAQLACSFGASDSVPLTGTPGGSPFSERSVPGVPAEPMEGVATIWK